MPSFPVDIVISTTMTETARYERMRYFNGLFLEEGEFNTEQSYFLAIRRFLNYLLFDEGRLFETAATPLQVTPHATLAMHLQVSPGAAMIRDTVRRFGHEVRIPDVQVIDLSSLGTPLVHDPGQSFAVTLFHNDAEIIAPAGGAGLASAQADRVQEQGLLHVEVPGDSTPPGPSILLATYTATSSLAGAVVGDPADTLSVVENPLRGGIRMQILSETVFNQLMSGTAPVAPLPGNFRPMALGDPYSRILGSNFATPLQITFPISSGSGTETVAIPSTDVTPGEIRIQSALLPADVIRGPVDISVPGPFTVPTPFDFVPPPVISGFTPASRSFDDLVTINGEHLRGPGLEILFDPYLAGNTRSGTSLPPFPSTVLGESVAPDGKSLVVLVKGANGNAPIRVKTEGGEVESSDLLTIS